MNTHAIVAIATREWLHWEGMEFVPLIGEAAEEGVSVVVGTKVEKREDKIRFDKEKENRAFLAKEKKRSCRDVTKLKVRVVQRQHVVECNQFDMPSTCSQQALVTITYIYQDMSPYFFYHYHIQRTESNNRTSISLWCLCLGPTTKRQRGQRCTTYQIPLNR